MKRILALLATLLLAAAAHAGGTVVCTGSNDGPAIQASLDAGGVTTLQGVCVATGQTITIHQLDGLGNQQGETVLQEGVLRAVGILVDGVRRATIRGVEVYASGAGLTVQNSIQLTIADTYWSTASHCIDLQSVAAVWAYGKNQCNATPAAMSATGIRIGASAQGFEAVDLSGFLVEGYYSCVRIGGQGNAVNIWMRGLKCDRPATFGVIFSPYGGGIRNVLVSDFWINGAPYPLVINGAETPAELVRIEFTNGHVLGNTYGPVTVWPGSGQIDYRQSGIVTGPLEPG